MGDPQRGLIAMGIIPGGDSAVNYIIEQPNRGKRSIGLDISTEHGRELLYKLVETSDVFLTSFLPEVRKKLKIDVDDIRAVNPNIVYARGSGQGTKGPDANRGGYDGASYWARGGVSNALTPECARVPDRWARRVRRPRRRHGHRRRHRGRAVPTRADRCGTDGRCVAARPGHVGAVARHRGVRPLRRRPDAEVRPLLITQPAGGGLQDEGRPLRHADAVAVRPLLARALHHMSVGRT